MQHSDSSLSHVRPELVRGNVKMSTGHVFGNQFWSHVIQAIVEDSLKVVVCNVFVEVNQSFVDETENPFDASKIWRVLGTQHKSMAFVENGGTHVRKKMTIQVIKGNDSGSRIGDGRKDCQSQKDKKPLLCGSAFIQDAGDDTDT